eukprot:2102554-Rhodomonas_salina.1
MDVSVQSRETSDETSSLDALDAPVALAPSTGEEPAPARPEESRREASSAPTRSWNWMTMAVHAPIAVNMNAHASISRTVTPGRSMIAAALQTTLALPARPAATNPG